MDMIDSKEAARILGVTQRTISIWLHQNKLPGYKLGVGRRAVWRIKRDELLKFVDSTANEAQKKKDEERMNYFRQVLENAPIDDEPYTEEDEIADREAEEDFKEGRTISIQELAKIYGVIK
jgi:excisionase family DNA binding protein